MTTNIDYEPYRKRINTIVGCNDEYDKYKHTQRLLLDIPLNIIAEVVNAFGKSYIIDNLCYNIRNLHKASVPNLIIIRQLELLSTINIDNNDIKTILLFGIDNNISDIISVFYTPDIYNIIISDLINELHNTAWTLPVLHKLSYILNDKWPVLTDEHINIIFKEYPYIMLNYTDFRVTNLIVDELLTINYTNNKNRNHVSYLFDNIDYQIKIFTYYQILYNAMEHNYECRDKYNLLLLTAAIITSTDYNKDRISTPIHKVLIALLETYRFNNTGSISDEEIYLFEACKCVRVHALLYKHQANEVLRNIAIDKFMWAFPGYILRTESDRNNVISEIMDVRYIKYTYKIELDNEYIPRICKVDN